MAFLPSCFVQLSYILVVLFAVDAKRKNVVLVITDDQDNFNYVSGTSVWPKLCDIFIHL